MPDELLDYGLNYLNIYALGTLFVMINLGLNGYISAQDYTKMAAFTVLVGALLNIGLDALLMFVLDFEVRGAAIATVVSQLASALLIIIFLRSKKSGVKLTFKGFKFNKHVAFRIVAVGISPFIMQATESLIQIVFNTQIVRYGGADYITYLNIMTIMLSVVQFIILPVNGLCHGASPLISYNYG